MSNSGECDVSLTSIPYKAKTKAVPLHATETLGGRGGRPIAPTHSRPRNKMGVSVQRHAPAAL
jgi:hypothetical protein